jgi:hypothetical protein
MTYSTLTQAEFSFDGTREIPLTRGMVALVDSHDYDFLLQWRWNAKINKTHRTFYATRTEGNESRTIHMHRVILSVPIGMSVDHINGNGLDNRRSNLRICTSHENSFNHSLISSNTSGYKGVCWNKASSKWQAGIMLNGKSTHLGLFSDPVDAARAYDVAARKLFGEFAWLNFPNDAESP